MNLPGKTVERLSMYKRLLFNCLKEGKLNIYSHEIAEKFVKRRIKGILNLTSLPLKVLSNIHLEEYDIITSLEKATYFANKL